MKSKNPKNTPDTRTPLFNNRISVAEAVITQGQGHPSQDPESSRQLQDSSHGWQPASAAETAIPHTQGNADGIN